MIKKNCFWVSKIKTDTAGTRFPNSWCNKPTFIIISNRIKSKYEFYTYDNVIIDQLTLMQLYVCCKVQLAIFS